MITMVFALRPTGIAKSHRPLQLISEAGLRSSGHSRIEEMLVGGREQNFRQLHQVILERDVKAIRANISAISEILPWTREFRNPTGIDVLRKCGNALVRAFRYGAHEETVRNFLQIKQLLQRLNVNFTEIQQARSFPVLAITNLDSISDDELNILLDHPGIRTFEPEPNYRPHQRADQTFAQPQAANQVFFPMPTADLPTVAVFDAGVSSNVPALAPWIVGKDIYVLPPETQQFHGTMVASLIAGARALNNDHDWLPEFGSLIYDVQGLEETPQGGRMSDIVERIESAVAKRPDIKIWNLSLGGGECDDQLYSELAIVLDRLSDDYQILFVISAGNYTDTPRRIWPGPQSLSDRISCPSEAVRALTIASLNHMTAPGELGSVGEPAPYSRRGPGPTFSPKPDVTHAGGGVHAPWTAGATSINAIYSNNTIGGAFGTSFSAPIASNIAAHTWRALENHPVLNPDPQLVKALIIHAAQLVSPDYSPQERRYYGSGRPEGVLETLYDCDDSFTLVFSASLVPGAIRWRKEPYPIPQSLRNEGKFRGEVIITAAYAAPLDADFGSEYVRANVDVSFGVLDGDRITGKVPMKSEKGYSGYEEKQIEFGGKWAPVKVHRKRFPNGASGDVWALQASASLRANEAAPIDGIPVFIIVTLRSISGNSNIKEDGLNELANTNWAYSNITSYVPVRV
jgi:serine protease AprX